MRYRKEVDGLNEAPDRILSIDLKKYTQAISTLRKYCYLIPRPYLFV